MHGRSTVEVFDANLLHQLSFLLLLMGVFLVSDSWAASLTLEEAWARAEEFSPALRTTRANLATVEGQLRDVRAPLWNNPQLSGEAVHRTFTQPALPNESSPEFGVGLSQTFELAGQQGHRREAAQRELEALKATIEETRRQIRAEVEQRFVRVLALQLLIGTEEQTLKFVDAAATAVKKRVTAGEDSRLDGNLAIVEAGRARNQLAVLREQLIQARADLAGVMQLPPADLPEVAGELVPRGDAYTLEQLLASASSRPRLLALEQREKAARSRFDLERAARYPDVTIGVIGGREGPLAARENFIGLSVAIPLPLFRRNATGIGRANTELAQAQIDRQTTERDVRANVIALWQRLESLRERAKQLNETVLPGLDENQRLYTKAFRAGEIGLVQLLLVNRQLLEGRRDLLDATRDLRLTIVEIEAAAGVLRGAAGQ